MIDVLIDVIGAVLIGAGIAILLSMASIARETHLIDRLIMAGCEDLEEEEYPELFRRADG